MTAKYTRRHYVDAARLIATTHASHGSHPAAFQALSELQRKYAEMFTAENPRFDADRFAAACSQ
jgi:hypothetical protein